MQDHYKIHLHATQFCGDYMVPYFELLIIESSRGRIGLRLLCTQSCSKHTGTLSAASWGSWISSPTWLQRKHRISSETLYMENRCDICLDHPDLEGFVYVTSTWLNRKAAARDFRDLLTRSPVPLRKCLHDVDGAHLWYNLIIASTWNILAFGGQIFRPKRGPFLS